MIKMVAHLSLAIMSATTSGPYLNRRHAITYLTRFAQHFYAAVLWVEGNDNCTITVILRIALNASSVAVK